LHEKKWYELWTTKGFEFICWTFEWWIKSGECNVYDQSQRVDHFYATLLWKFCAYIETLKDELVKCVNFRPQMHIWLPVLVFFINFRSNLFIIAEILLSGCTRCWTCIFIWKITWYASVRDFFCYYYHFQIMSVRSRILDTLTSFGIRFSLDTSNLKTLSLFNCFIIQIDHVFLK